MGFLSLWALVIITELEDDPERLPARTLVEAYIR
jgi:hypothetical protein